MFKRKAFDKPKYWKDNRAPKYAVLLEGARRVGKTTIAEEFAKQEYRSYIKIDSHYYEVDFLLSSKTKIVPLEVKSSGLGKHESITVFQKKILQTCG